jgi:hypothetical protein
MIKKAIVCCHEADQEMLPIFIERWRDLYPDVELWLGNDSVNPVTIDHDLPSVKITWGNGVARSIVNAMLETGGDIVAWQAVINGKTKLAGFWALLTQSNARRYLRSPYRNHAIRCAAIKRIQQ